MAVVVPRVIIVVTHRAIALWFTTMKILRFATLMTVWISTVMTHAHPWVPTVMNQRVSSVVS